MRESLIEYCIRYDRRKLLDEWHPKRNAELCSDRLALFSNRRHEWQAGIPDRALKHSDCPHCTNRREPVEFDDLNTVESRIAAQWHPDKKCAVGAECVASRKCGYPPGAGKPPQVYH